MAEPTGHSVRPAQANAASVSHTENERVNLSTDLYGTERVMLMDASGAPIPVVGGALSVALDIESAITQRFDYDGSGLMIYQGEALSAGGPSTAAAVWRIQKYTYTSLACTLRQWAGGVNTFTSIWDNRASLTYY